MTPNEKIAILVSLLPRDAEECGCCGQMIPGSPGLITPEQAIELLNYKGED